MQTAQAHLQVLTCPACDSPLDRQRFDVVTSRFKQTVSESLDAERLELKAQLARDVAAAYKTAQEGAARLVNAARIERDAAVKGAEDATAQRDVAVAVGVAEAREKWSEERRQALEEQAALAASREASLNEKVSALGKQDEAATRSIQELQAQLREAAERQWEVERRSEADKNAAVEAARAAERSNHAQSLAAAASKVKEANDREAATVARAAEAAKSFEARVKEAARAAEANARQVLEAEYQRILGERAADAAREREALTNQVNGLQRRLADQTPNEIGDGAELDLFEELRSAFEDDRVTRVPKGTAGADIHIEVREHGQAAGLIIVDSKDRKDWKTAYATKLRQDQVDAQADHATLSTTIFPKGCKELHRESGVIIAAPKRVVAIVGMMRDEVINAFRLRASHEERAGKKEALYVYITSRGYHQKLEEIDRHNVEMQDLDVEESKQHRKTWDRRGKLLKLQQHAIGDIRVEVAGIVASNVAPPE